MNVYMSISVATTIQGGKGCEVTDVEKNHTSKYNPTCKV